MGVPKNGGFIRENPTKMDDDWGYPYDSGNPHMGVELGPGRLQNELLAVGGMITHTICRDGFVTVLLVTFSGWWFGIFFIFPLILGIIIPID